MSHPTVRWGILGVEKIATEKVIPAMQRGQYSEVVGIASRSLDKATAAAKRLGLPKAYGSYEELLADQETSLPTACAGVRVARLVDDGAGERVLRDLASLDASQPRALLHAWLGPEFHAPLSHH